MSHAQTLGTEVGPSWPRVPPELCYTHPASPLFLGAMVNITSEDDNSSCHHVTYRHSQASLVASLSNCAHAIL